MKRYQEPIRLCIGAGLAHEPRILRLFRLDDAARFRHEGRERQGAADAVEEEQDAEEGDLRAGVVRHEAEADEEWAARDEAGGGEGAGAPFVGKRALMWTSVAARYMRVVWLKCSYR